MSYDFIGLFMRIFLVTIATMLVCLVAIMCVKLSAQVEVIVTPTITCPHCGRGLLIEAKL